MKWLNVRQLDTVLKQLNVRQSDIFPYFSSKSKKCLYENVLPLFTILKRFQAAKSFELDVFANPVYRVRSHPSAWHLETFQWHGWTRSLINSIFLFEIYQFSLGNILPLFRTSSASRKWKKLNVVRFADLVHRVQRDPSVLENFLRTLPDTVFE